GAGRGLRAACRGARGLAASSAAGEKRRSYERDGRRRTRSRQEQGGSIARASTAVAPPLRTGAGAAALERNVRALLLLNRERLQAVAIRRLVTPVAGVVDPPEPRAVAARGVPRSRIAGVGRLGLALGIQRLRLFEQRGA